MMSSLSPSPEKDAIEGALQTFQERIKSSLPLRHFTEFHQESKLEEVALQERARILVEFMPNIASLGNSDTIPVLLQKLIFEVENVIENLRKKNQEHRKTTESVMDTFVDAHCSRYEIFIEAQLSLNPGMVQGQREYLFEITKSLVVRSFESEWFPGEMNIEFCREQKAKLEMKLDLIKNRIQTNQRTNAESVEAQEAREEFEEDTSSNAQHDLRNLDTGNGLNASAFSIWNPLQADSGPAGGSMALPKLDNNGFSWDGQYVDKAGGSQVWNESAFHPPPEDSEMVELEVEVDPCALVNNEGVQEDCDTYPVAEEYPFYSEFVGSNFRTFQCRFCKKKFKSKDCLKNHELCGNKGGVMRYKCNKCGEYFNNRSQFKSHLWSHTGERPFVCQVCKRSFSSNEGLRVHMNIHTGKHACDQCSSTFRCRADLKRHLITHSGVRPYGCPLCSARFNRKFTRDKHLEWVHNLRKQVSREIGNNFAKRMNDVWPEVTITAVSSAAMSNVRSKAAVQQGWKDDIALTGFGNSASKSFGWNPMLPANGSSSTVIPVVDLSD